MSISITYFSKQGSPHIVEYKSVIWDNAFDSYSIDYDQVKSKVRARLNPAKVNTVTSVLYIERRGQLTRQKKNFIGFSDFLLKSRYNLLHGHWIKIPSENRMHAVFEAIEADKYYY